MASHCTRETTSTVSVERPEQDLGVAVAHFDDESVGDDDKKCLCVRQRTCWIGAIALVFLTGIAIIAVAALSGGAASSTEEEDSGPPRESEAFYQERFAAFRPLVGQYSETSTLLQTGTPQSQALDWLVYEDRTVSHTSIGDTTQLRQRYAIMVLFYACGGEDWQGFEEASLDKQGETPTCDWEGSDFLQCSPATKEVNRLELSNRRLGGVLPDELTLLTALESLVLDFNFLEGPIPNSYFEKLTNLQELVLEQNEFVGTLPPTINKLSRLETFNVGDNYLSGPLPLELGELSRLTTLVLKDNPVRGDFFDKFGASWPMLDHLVLDGTQLAGTIPASLGEWKFDVLSLAFVQFSGPFPELTASTDIRKLSVAGSNISGTFPDLSQHLMMEDFNWEGDNFVGTIPSTVGLLTDLKEFWVRRTSFSGTLPTEIGNCRNLERIVMPNNRLYGTLPSELGNLKKLNVINIKDNYNLTGTFPETLCDRASSGQLHVIRSCDLECECCVDKCFKGGGSIPALP